MSDIKFIDRKCPNCGIIVPAMKAICPNCNSRVSYARGTKKEKDEINKTTLNENSKVQSSSSENFNQNAKNMSNNLDAKSVKTVDTMATSESNLKRSGKILGYFGLVGIFAVHMMNLNKPIPAAIEGVKEGFKNRVICILVLILGFALIGGFFALITHGFN